MFDSQRQSNVNIVIHMMTSVCIKILIARSEHLHAVSEVVSLFT